MYTYIYIYKIYKNKIYIYKNLYYLLLSHKQHFIGKNKIFLGVNVRVKACLCVDSSSWEYK